VVRCPQAGGKALRLLAVRERRFLRLLRRLCAGRGLKLVIAQPAVCRCECLFLKSHDGNEEGTIFHENGN
jgi:hypothetical protein